MPGGRGQAEVRIGPQGRVVIPAALRRELGVSAGDLLMARVEGEGRLILERREAARARIQARLAPVPRTVKLADELIAERRREARRELGPQRARRK